MHVLASRQGAQQATIQIANRQVDSTAPPYVIAEIGVNHDGCIDRARKLIDAAVDGGADAAKFQAFDPETLVSATAPAAGYQAQRTGVSTQRDLLRGLALSHRDLRLLSEHCTEAGIHFLATPFDIEQIRVLDSIGVPAIKLASTDIDHLPLIDAAVATGRPVLLSTGASRVAEIERAVDWIDQRGGQSRRVVMHCISSYPTSIDHAALQTIRMLSERYAGVVGFSDHTTSVFTGAVAVGCGASVLEKHVTWDCSATGADHAASLMPSQFAEYVHHAHQAHRMLGSARTEAFAVEQDVRSVARRSIVARVAIPAGARIESSMLVCQRPGGGLSPSRWNDVVGRVARCDLPAATRLDETMLT